MSPAFSHTLREENQAHWDAAINHRFVDELLDGTIDDQVMAEYLIQDHRFLEAFVTLLGAAMTSADTFEAKLRFGRFGGTICSEENTYFLRSFEALEVSAERRESTADTQPTAGIIGLMLQAAETRDYVAALAVLNVAEWLYYDWAHRLEGELPASFVHAEWITLHNNAEFDEFVSFLRSELDRLGPTAEATAHDYFTRAVDLELAFFDAVYEMGEK